MGKNILFCRALSSDKVARHLVDGDNVAIFEPNLVRALFCTYVYSLLPGPGNNMDSALYGFKRVNEVAKRRILKSDSDSNKEQRIVSYFRVLVAETISSLWDDMIPVFLYAILFTWEKLNTQDGGLYDIVIKGDKVSVRYRLSEQKVFAEVEDFILNTVDATIREKKVFDDYVEDNFSNSISIMSPHCRVFNVDITNFHLISVRRAQNTFLPKEAITLGHRSFYGVVIPDQNELQMFKFDKVYNLFVNSVNKGNLRDFYMSEEEEEHFKKIVHIEYALPIKLRDQITDEEWDRAVNLLHKMCIKSNN